MHRDEFTVYRLKSSLCARDTPAIEIITYHSMSAQWLRISTALVALALIFHTAAASGGGFLRDPTVQASHFNAFDSIVALTKPYGYPLEEHFVTTQDGYILRLFRIPGGSSHGRKQARSLSSVEKRPAILLLPGLLDSAADFLLLGPGKAFGLLLADAGYDVWLANSRGSTYSRAHKYLDLSSPQYWAFSWDEFVKYDLPVKIDKVLEVSGQSQLRVMGYSQGGTQLLAGLSTQPALVQKIKVAVLLAPMAYLTHIQGPPLLYLTALATDDIYRILGNREFLPSQPLIQLMEGQLCYSASHLCTTLLAAIGGVSVETLNASRLPLLLQYTPGGTSTKNIVHWTQMVKQTRYRTLARYDYGTDCSTSWWHGSDTCNQKKYGQEEAPAYPINKVTTPLIFITGGRDMLADPTDTEALRQVLAPGGAIRSAVYVERYMHLDFVWAENAGELVYKPAIKFLEAYRN